MSSHDLQSHSSRNASTEDLEPFLGQSSEKRSNDQRSRRNFMRRDLGPALPWMLTTGIMSIVCLVLALRPLDIFLKGSQEPRCKSSNTYEAGFDTELGKPSGQRQSTMTLTPAQTSLSPLSQHTKSAFAVASSSTKTVLSTVNTSTASHTTSASPLPSSSPSSILPGLICSTLPPSI